MNIYIRKYIHTYKCEYTDVYTYMYMFICIGMHIYIHIHMHTHIYIHISKCTYDAYVDIHICMNIYSLFHLQARFSKLFPKLEVKRVGID